MLPSAITLISVLSLIHSSKAQCAGGPESLYEACTSTLQDQFYTSTCVPLLISNEKPLFDACMCYYGSNQANCFSLCPGNSTLQEMSIVHSQNVSQNCSAIGLDWKALPVNPPWTPKGKADAEIAAKSKLTNGSSNGSSSTAPSSSSSVTLGLVSQHLGVWVLGLFIALAV